METKKRKKDQDLKKKFVIILHNVIMNLDGVFSFLLFDRKNSKLFVCRDTFGVRPLFYGYSIINPDVKEDKEEKEVAHKTKEEVTYEYMFASEAKALVPQCSEICRFPPGCFTIIDTSEPPERLKFETWFPYYKSKKGFPVMEWPDLTKNLIDQTVHLIKENVINAVDKRIMSDRPVGCLLSGGLDSSLISGLVSRQYELKNASLMKSNKSKINKVGLQIDHTEKLQTF